MTKRADLIKQIQAAAEARSIACGFVRHGSRHDIWRVGRVQFSVPRHRELGERLADAIRASLESEFGEGWWR